MEFDFINVALAVAAGTVPLILVQFYRAWRDKVVADGVADWKDEVVKAVETFAEGAKKPSA